MGSKSQASKSQADTNTSTALERDNVMQNGQMISDSIIIDPSDETMKAIVASFQSEFATLVSGNSASTQQFSALAGKVLDLADKTQIHMSDFGYNSLKSAYDFLNEQMAQGKYMLDLASNQVDHSYTLANQVVWSNSDTVNQALGLLGDVKTGDFTANLKSVTGMVMLFSLGAIYMAVRGRK
jgi:hypothetical protein